MRACLMVTNLSWGGRHTGEGEGMTISHGSGQGNPTDAVRLTEQTLQKEGVLGSVEPDLTYQARRAL